MATRVYAMSINTNIGGQFATNILHYQFDDSGFASTAAAANALITAWDTAATTAFKAMCSQHTTFLTLKARLVSAAGGFEAVRPYAAGVVGSRAGTMDAAGLSACVIFYPTLGTAQRGRTFLPGLSANDAVDGIFTAAFKTQVSTNTGTAFGGLTLVGGGGPSADHVIYNRVTKVGHLIGNIQLSDMIAQVRRRQLPV